VPSSACSRSQVLWDFRLSSVSARLSLTGGRPTVLCCLSGGGYAPETVIPTIVAMLLRDRPKAMAPTPL